jgi:phage baseplate assembly protein W
VRQIDFVSIARDENLDIVLFAPTPGPGSATTEFTIKTQEGDYALQKDLDELLNNPMFTRIYAPFYGHHLEELAQAPNGPNILRDLKKEWRRVLRHDDRVESPTVDYDGTDYVFVVKSKLTGELITTLRR